MTAKKTEKTATPVDAAVNAGKETMEKFTKVSQEAAQKNVDAAVVATKENVEKASAAFFKGFDQFTNLAQANVDAMSKSMDVMTKGMESASKTWFAFTQTTVDASVDFGKQVMGAKSVNEIVDLQNTYAKTTFDGMVAESSKVSEMAVKTANEAFAPLKAQLEETVETMVKPAA